MIVRFGRVLLVGALFALSTYAAVVPCTTSSLHVYDVSGFACSENGGNEIFSNFSFSDTGSDNPLPVDTSVTVNPLADGFEFDAGFFVPAGLTLDVLIKYTVTMSPGTLTGDSLSIAGFGQSGSGALDVAESVCVGAPFNASGACVPPAFTDSLNVFDNSGGLKQSDSVTFSATTVGIVKDISLTGGTTGSANLSLVDNITPFSVSAGVPEPATLTLIGLGLVGLVRIQRKR